MSQSGEISKVHNTVNTDENNLIKPSLINPNKTKFNRISFYKHACSLQLINYLTINGQHKKNML